VRRGAKYFGFDAGRPQACNFVRAHDFFCLLTENFAAERLRALDEGRSVYDLPPIALFDQKLALALPFWDETRDHFDADTRSLFPYVTLVTPEGVRLEEGEWITLEQVSALATGKRGYFLKYAGADVCRNWGSRAVFRLDTCSHPKCLTLLRSVTEPYARGERWILQRPCPTDAEVSFITRAGDIETMSGHCKRSTFYGPTGVLGAKSNFEGHFKVHMSPETVMSVDLIPELDAVGL